MSSPHPEPHTPLTEGEWAELHTLKSGIDRNPSCFGPALLERFTSLLIKSIRERGG